MLNGYDRWKTDPGPEVPPGSWSAVIEVYVDTTDRDEQSRAHWSYTIEVWNDGYRERDVQRYGLRQRPHWRELLEAAGPELSYCGNDVDLVVVPA